MDKDLENALADLQELYDFLQTPSGIKTLEAVYVEDPEFVYELYQAILDLDALLEEEEG